MRLVSTAAETYFKERAEVMRRLEVLNNTLAQNTKYIVPTNSDLVAVLGLDGVTPPIVPIKSGQRGQADAARAATDADRGKS